MHSYSNSNTEGGRAPQYSNSQMYVMNDGSSQQYLAGEHQHGQYEQGAVIAPGSDDSGCCGRPISVALSVATLLFVAATVALAGVSFKSDELYRSERLFHDSSSGSDYFFHVTVGFFEICIDVVSGGKVCLSYTSDDGKAACGSACDDFETARGLATAAIIFLAISLVLALASVVVAANEKQRHKFVALRVVVICLAIGIAVALIGSAERVMNKPVEDSSVDYSAQDAHSLWVVSGVAGVVALIVQLSHACCAGGCC